MTAPYGRESQPGVMGEMASRIQILEAENPSTGLTAPMLTPNQFSMVGIGWRSIITNYPSSMNGRIGGVGGFGFVTDSTAPGGGYIENTSQDQEFIMFGMPLGPLGSGWAVNVWAGNGLDKGILQLEWATTTADELSYFNIGSDVSIADPAEVFSVTGSPLPFYKTTQGGSASSAIDWYGGSGWGFISLRSPLVVAGADGQMLAADGTANTGFVAHDNMYGGGDPSVYWWLRMRVNGKNASSSGYNMKIAAVYVARYNANGVPIT